jgi:hypothetical protein
MMERIPSPGEKPGDPTPEPGEDVREPPLPGDRDPDIRDPDERGESIKKRLD